MKHNITIDQWNELSDSLKLAYQKWCSSNGYEKPRTHIINHPNLSKGRLFNAPSIGQMIEFLDNKSSTFEELIIICKHDSDHGVNYVVVVNALINNSEELCDALWDHVVTKLEKEYVTR